MALARSRFTDEAGFSLAEVMVAACILCVGLVSLAQLFAISTRGNAAARNNTYAVLLAEQKMEQLRGLTWGFDTAGLPLSDTSTDLSAVGTQAGCPAPAGGNGTGLSPSPTGTLGANTDGWVDYLNASGCVIGGGGAPPQGTMYIRRWSVEPLPTNPNNTLILQVLVARNKDRGDADAGNVARLPEEARLMSVKTRKMK
jgi:hypothetical protein